MRPTVDLIVLYEHPEWQKPLFAALERRGISFLPFDLARAAFSDAAAPSARLYFNQASPSAYIRGHTRAVPFALALMRSLELRGARVLNGADVFALELSKSTQATLLRTLGIDCPRSITFNDVSALRSLADTLAWPALLKPDQGGSGARIHVVASIAEVEEIFQRDPSVWLPDNLFLLQEYLPHDSEQGIVRLEFLGGELLYAMRVKTHGRFNLCPSPVCNPEEGDSVCAAPAHRAVDAPPVEFHPYADVPRDAVDTAKRIVQAARLDVGGIEYLETDCGRRVFYDINANSNLRPSVAATFGFDPFERVVDWLEAQLVSTPA
jgi:glutathione synthase/RimK-type ligase-like ATP-grasp enzyme